MNEPKNQIEQGDRSNDILNNTATTGGFVDPLPPVMPLPIESNKDIFEALGGGYCVRVPRGYDVDSGLVFSTDTEHYTTYEEAQKAHQNSWAQVNYAINQPSLKKSFGTFFNILELSDGGFRVRTPGLIAQNGDLVGTTERTFPTWEQAQIAYLEARAKYEEPTKNPILSIEIGENVFANFVNLEDFNPQIAPTDKARIVPDPIQKAIFDNSINGTLYNSDHTYRNTINESGWTTNLFEFVSSYYEEHGKETLEQLGIKNLDYLTPKQAIELSTRIVVGLTKYRHADEAYGNAETPADISTALGILKDGLENKEDPNWEGNGVCRNFASTLKAVFEAIKVNQTKFNRLRDTYCLYETGQTAYAPKRVIDKKDGSHAWNVFVTICANSKIDAVAADVTWANQDLDTKEVKGLGYTNERIEPYVGAIASMLPAGESKAEGEFVKILLWYVKKIESPGDTGGWVTAQEAAQFYATRALFLIGQKGLPQNLPPEVIKKISDTYLEINKVNPSEIKALFRLSQREPDSNFDTILKKYLEDKDLTHHTSDYHQDPPLLFEDNDLQKRVFVEMMKKEGWEWFIKKNSRFRVRMREVMPESFDGFSPATKPEDLFELKYLIQGNHFIDRTVSILTAGSISEEVIAKVYSKVRLQLQNLNPELFDSTYTGMDDYQLVKQFDSLYTALRWKGGEFKPVKNPR